MEKANGIKLLNMSFSVGSLISSKALKIADNGGIIISMKK
jgi:hypothetical protein